MSFQDGSHLEEFSLASRDFCVEILIGASAQPDQAEIPSERRHHGDALAARTPLTSYLVLLKRAQQNLNHVHKQRDQRSELQTFRSNLAILRSWNLAL